MRTCIKCQEKLEEKNFSFKNKEKGLYNSYCKTCNKAYHRKHYQNNKELYSSKAKEWTKEYKSEVYSLLRELAKDGCVLCEEKDFCCLDFDHIDPITKRFGISEMLGSKMAVSLIKEELLKCRVLCSNCHRKHTASQFNYYNGLIV